MKELKTLAAKGHTPSQCFLARLLYLGKAGVAENKVDAAKWALIASAKVESARALVKEIELFMTIEQIKAAKDAAEKFRNEQKAAAPVAIKSSRFLTAAVWFSAGFNAWARHVAEEHGSKEYPERYAQAALG